MPLRINLKSLLLYIVYGGLAALLNIAFKGVPLSVSLFFAILACGANAAATPLIFIAASAVHADLMLTLVSLFPALFLTVVTLLYRRRGIKMKFEAAIYIAVSLAPYVALADWRGALYIQNTYIMKAVAAAIMLIFSYFCYRAVHAAAFRLCRCRLREEEIVSLALVASACGLGLYNTAGYAYYIIVNAALCTFFVRLFRSPAALICAIVFAIPPALSLLSPVPLAVFVPLYAVCLLFAAAGRLPCAAVSGGISAAYVFFTGGFDCAPAIIVLKAVLLICAAFAPAVASDGAYRRLKDRIMVREVLQGAAAARAKRATGERLYRLADVFREMQCAFMELDERPDEKSVRSRIFDELYIKRCKNCERRKKCEKTGVYSGFKKLIDSGCCKGRVNLIDLPSEVTANCAAPSELMSALNGLLNEYRRAMTEFENAKNGRAMLAEQAHGVSEVMKNCAVELCRRSENYQSLEESIVKKLAAKGVSCPEISVCGDEVSAVICGKPDIKLISSVISDCAQKKLALRDKICYDAEKNCLVFAPPPAFDAAFGVAQTVKNGEKASGDTHSVIRINEHSFLMALSDGMGSGEYARKISNTAISLIEAFYRAEMPGDAVLNTINRLLSFNRDERFACVDVAAVDLNSGRADFVKIGSPASIIVREGEIKVLESQSLPLGILDNLKPAVKSEQLKDGDITVFMSDGVTSAFPSATELYEFLRGLTPLNPQQLADKILAAALKFGGGVAADDMTVLCTRIFENR